MFIKAQIEITTSHEKVWKAVSDIERLAEVF